MHDSLNKLIIVSHTGDDSPGRETQGSGEAVFEQVATDAGRFSEVRLTSNMPALTVIKKGPCALEDLNLPPEPGNSRAKYVEHFAEKLPKLAENLRQACEQADGEQARIISVGGNHITAIELLGYLQYCQQNNFEPVVVWWDAHLDCNTPATSETGNVHGMVAALLLGEGPEELKAQFKGVPLPRPGNIIFVGSNSEDGSELDLINKFPEGEKPIFIPARQYSGGARLQEELMNRVSDNPRIRIWMELDMDAISQSEAPGVVMRNSTGMTAAETHRFISWLAKDMSKSFLGMRITEICLKNDEADMTVRLAKDLIFAAVGIENKNYHMDGCQRPLSAGSQNLVISSNGDGLSSAKQKFSKYGRFASYMALTVSACAASVGGLIWSFSERRSSSDSSLIAAKAPMDPLATANSLESEQKDALIASLIEKLKNQEHQHILLNASKINSPAINRGNKGEDAQYAYTNIHRMNRFVPINQTGEKIHSVDTLIDIAKTYLEILDTHESFEGQLKRERDRILSCLLAAERNGGNDEHWKALKNFFVENIPYRGREVFFGLSCDYTSFKEQVDLEEVKNYLVVWGA